MTLLLKMPPLAITTLSHTHVRTQHSRRVVLRKGVLRQREGEERHIQRHARNRPDFVYVGLEPRESLRNGHEPIGCVRQGEVDIRVGGHALLHHLHQRIHRLVARGDRGAAVRRRQQERRGRGDGRHEGRQRCRGLRGGLCGRGDGASGRGGRGGRLGLDYSEAEEEDKPARWMISE